MKIVILSGLLAALMAIIITLALYWLIKMIVSLLYHYIHRDTVSFVSRRELSQVKNEGYWKDWEKVAVQPQWYDKVAWLLSTTVFISNATLALNPFKVWCPECQKDYSQISDTSASSGSVHFLSIWPWADYEKIVCHCGRVLRILVIKY